MTSSPTKDVLKTLYQHAEVVEQTRRDGIIVPAQDAPQASVGLCGRPTPCALRGRMGIGCTPSCATS